MYEFPREAGFMFRLILQANASAKPEFVGEVQV